MSVLPRTQGSGPSMGRHTGAFFSALALTIALGMPIPAQARDMAGATERLADTIAARAECRAGAELMIGIFPFDEARLPLAPGGAFALYEAFLGDLVAGAPDCVRFIDGRGAFVTLEYLGRGEMLRESGQQQRARIRDTLASADFTLDGTVVETAEGPLAVFRFTDMASGQALGRAEFAVPQRYRGDGCGVGALPVDAAVRGIASDLLDRTSGLIAIKAGGGRHGPTDTVTDAGRYLEGQVLAELAQAAENIFSDRAVRIQRSDAPAAPTMGQHALHLHYWPCDGDGAARLSVTLRDAEGRDVSEQRDISLASLPAGLPLRPATPSGELVVTPAVATIGDDIALLAAPPAGCAPFFFNLAPSGRVTPIPLQFFRQLDLGGGLVRYEISPQWDFGLVVEEEDEPGLNRLGYLCQPMQLSGDAALRGLLRALRDGLAGAAEGLLEAEGAEPVYFQTQGFEIVH